MTETLDWDNLKTLNCPKCYGDLEKQSFNKTLICKCSFVITEERIREIVESMFNKSGDHFGRAEFEEMMAGE